MTAGTSAGAETDRLSATRGLASALADQPFSELPPSTVEEAKRVLLDSISATFLGLADPACAPYLALRERAAEPGSTVLGGGPRLTASSAAAYHASVSHQVELAPAVSRAVLHLNGIAMGALTQAEAAGADGRALLRATAHGCEAAIRFGLALNRAPDHAERGDHPVAFLRGWWTPALAGTFGTAAVGVLLHDGSAEQLHDAWGIAANVAPAGVIHTVHEGATGKGYLMGAATVTGMASAALALAGATGLHDIAGSWLPVVAEGSDPSALDDGLPGRREFTHVLYKPYAAVGPTFASLDAVLGILADHPEVRDTDIAAIEVDGFARTVRFLQSEPPTTPEGARGSLGYLVAAAVFHRDPAYFLADAFTPSAIADQRVARLSRLVTARVDAEFDREYPLRSARARVRLRLRDGRVLEAESDRHAVSKYHRPTRDELSAKFRAASARILPPDAADEVLGLVWGLDEVGDVADLMRALGASRARGGE